MQWPLVVVNLFIYLFFDPAVQDPKCHKSQLKFPLDIFFWLVFR